MLDVFHALEHIAGTGQTLHADAAAVAAWTAAGRAALLHGGWRGITEHMARSFPQPTVPQQAAIDQLLDYLVPHQHHMNYAERLGQGRSIGSGPRKKLRMSNPLMSPIPTSDPMGGRRAPVARVPLLPGEEGRVSRGVDSAAGRHRTGGET